MMDPLDHWLNGAGTAGAWYMLLLFLAASFLMIWRLEHMADLGMEGTVLGTLVMPYCSGLGNLLLVFVVARGAAAGREIMTNCLVNNVTNLTLLVGLPALIWGLNLAPGQGAPKRKKDLQEFRVNRLSLLLSMVAALFFTLALWMLGRDGTLDFSDGVVLIGLFLFWQCFQIYDVLKQNVQRSRSFHALIYVDLLFLLVGAGGVYVSLDWLVQWLTRIESGFISGQHLGWLSGWLMVLPNAMLALYYAWKKRAEVVFASQVGDGHICIPLSIGLYAVLHPMNLPDFFILGIKLILSAIILHGLFLVVFGRLPRIAGLALTVAYGWFVYRGLL